MSIRKNVLFFMVVTVIILGFTGPVSADDKYPSRPITLIVPFSPGGDTDLIARVWAGAIEEKLGVPIIVVNKAGGSGVVASTYVANAKPDGYTLLTSCYGPNIMAPQITKTSYNLESFVPLCRIVTAPMGLMVKEDSKFKSFDDFIRAAKAGPRNVSVASWGAASWGTIATNIWSSTLGISLKMVEYPGGAPAVVSVLGGHVDSAMSLPQIYGPHVKAGKARLLVSAQKLNDYPDVPTFADYGVEEEFSVWNGIFAPTGTPEEAQSKIIDATKQIIDSPEIVDTVKKMGGKLSLMSGEEWGASLNKQYSSLTKALKIKK